MYQYSCNNLCID